jgi:hypothetical protein
MVDPAVFPLAELDCRDQDTGFEPQGLKSQTVWTLAEILLYPCYRRARFLHPGHGARPPRIGYHRAASQQRGDNLATN